MPFGVPLAAATVTALQQQQDATTNADLRLRAQMVMLAHCGRSVAEIAQRAFRSDDTVQRVLARVRDGGLAALPHRYAAGPAPTMTPDCCG